MLVIIPGDLSGTLRSLDQLAEDVSRVGYEALDWYGRTATERMKANHDRDAHSIQRYVNRTWYLTTTIGFDLQRMTGGIVRLRMYSPAAYAEAVEFGTTRSAPYPFFWLEVYGVQPLAVERLAAAYYALFAQQEGRARAS